MAGMPFSRTLRRSLPMTDYYDEVVVTRHYADGQTVSARSGITDGGFDLLKDPQKQLIAAIKALDSNDYWNKDKAKDRRLLR
jgi:hypothetical protein